MMPFSFIDVPSWSSLQRNERKKINELIEKIGFLKDFYSIQEERKKVKNN